MTSKQKTLTAFAIIWIPWLIPIISFTANWQDYAETPFYRVLLALCLLILSITGYCFLPQRFHINWKTLTLTACMSWLAILLYNTQVFFFPNNAPLCVMSACSFFLVGYALLRRYFLFILPIFLLVSQLNELCFFAYQTKLNIPLMQNIIGAPIQEWLVFFTWQNVTILIICLLLIALFIYALHRILKHEKSIAMFICACTILCCSASLREIVYPFQNRDNKYLTAWPLGTFMEIWNICSDSVAANKQLLNTIESLPSPADKPSSISTLQGGEGVICLLHIGESVRADRLSINGYKRETTPWLRCQDRLINFPNCVASSAYTFNAVPVILTNARRHLRYHHNQGANMGATCGSVADLFAANTFKCYFHMHDRNSGSEARERKENNMQSLFGRLMKSLCRNSDGLIRVTTNLIEQPRQIKELINQNGNENIFIIINNVGSHYPYDMYDLNNPVFTPSSPSAYHNSPQTNPEANEQLQGAYDNTIHYMDEYIRRLITGLNDRPLLYLYVSDHGEYIGHDGKWGRADMGINEGDFYVTSGCKVPLFIYTSPAFEQQHPHFKQAIDELKKNTQVYTAHEHVFHTLLGIFGIKTEHYDKTLDLSSPDVRPYNGPNPDNK